MKRYESHKGNKSSFLSRLMMWHEENRRSFPWRTCEDPYKVLVAEVLLQRTPASRVSKFFNYFVQKFPNPRSIMTKSIEELENVLQPMGLKKRARWLIELMTQLCENYDCKIPDQKQELTKLLGVGPYTACAVLSFGFRQDVAIVDVNVARVLSRVFDLPFQKKRPSDDKELWDFASKLLPKGAGPHYNEALLDFAALICKKNPLCHICPISNICEYYIRA